MSRQRGVVLVLSLVAVWVTIALSWAEPDKGKKMTAEEQDRALADIAAAFEMADAGRRAGSPEALIGAARILMRAPAVTRGEGVKPITSKADAEKPRGKEVTVVKEAGTAWFDAEIRALLKKARELNKGDDHVDSLIEALALAQAEREKDTKRGSIRGPASFDGSVEAGSMSTYTFRFVGNSPARIVLTNHDGVPLQLEIYNEAGVLIRSATRRGTIEVDWRPIMTRNFTVYVTNRGEAFANFTLYKN